MAKYYYKTSTVNLKKLFRLLGALLIAAGALMLMYTFAPILSWQIYFAPIFASQNIESPIPKTTVLDASQISTLIAQARNNIIIDYSNAANWYPNYNPKDGKKTGPDLYSISIKKLGIDKAEVSTVDYDLTKHTVNYQGTAIPPNSGNAVIFGHSTLPQLFNPKDYKTIFSTAYKLQVGDEILVNLPQITYKYKVFSIIVVDPENTSVLEQNYGDSFLTLITCTPPGTVWKRLVIKAKLDKI
ncbi:MAG: sortase [Patescibacteria group bacterium]